MYYRGKIIGGIYDNRLLIIQKNIAYIPATSYVLPYKGAKQMLLVDAVATKEYLTGLFKTIYDKLPIPKAKKQDKRRFSA